MQQNKYLVDDGRSMRQRMLAGDDYIADDPDLVVANRRAIELSFRFEQTWPADPEVRPPLRVDYGSYISIGARTFINYNLTALDVAPITIGGGAIVLPGVTVGENSVIGAGAVVTRDVPSNVVVVGNPARVVRELNGTNEPDPA